MSVRNRLSCALLCLAAVASPGLAQQSAQDAGIWPAASPTHRAYLCGTSADMPADYIDALNAAIAARLEELRKRRPGASENDAFELIRRVSCRPAREVVVPGS